MPTGSTKRNRKRARDDWSATSLKNRREAEEARPAMTPAPAPASELPERAWVYASALILLLAFALRVYALDMKPLHHDEGVNGFFLTNLLRQGRYAYDPENYHGPTLYYLTLPFVALAGLHTFVIRLVPSLFGVGVVWLVLSLRRYTGTVAALVAGLLVAVSPACVFYSRYFIHEMPFLFFTLALVVSALRFRETGAASDLLFASASAALMFATKETAFISAGTLGLAWLTAMTWERLRGVGRAGRARAAESEGGGFAKLLRDERGAAAVLGAVVLFAVIWVAFYSSFSTHWKGAFWDSLKTFAVWRKTGMSEFHAKPAGTYVRWLMQEDVAVLVLGTVGALVALFERRLNRFAVFFAAWGFGLLVAYSLISYKTPWLVLNFVVPLAVAGGYAAQAFGAWVSRAPARGWRAAAAVGLFAALFGLYHTFVINFRDYDNDKYPYVYSQTRREFLDLVREIERAGERAGTKEPGVATASPEYWPSPWYFRHNPRAGYEGTLASSYDPQKTHAIIGRKDQLEQLQRVAGANYTRVGDTYPLRPGVDLVLFVRRDLAPKQ
ncbi:MAG TPA: flippase activity-associated protein Agl23 [Pyrinomonadaceae bacterium]|nr:flippase activity-associated protein Agl23 [Pyrinomonadaceae bacterium]